MAKSDFTRKLDAWVTKTEKLADQRIRRIALACFQRIQEISPVDLGTFRANWNLAFGTINRAFDGGLSSENVASKTSDAMMIASEQKLLGTTIFISNSAPYATALEHGYSRQAPAGVVGPVVRIIKQAIEAGAL